MWFSWFAFRYYLHFVQLLHNAQCTQNYSSNVLLRLVSLHVFDHSGCYEINTVINTSFHVFIHKISRSSLLGYYYQQFEFICVRPL